MRTSIKLLTAALVIGLATPALAQKSRTGIDSAKEPEERPLGLNLKDTPVETLYREAWDKLDDKAWSLSAQTFEEVERQHPYTEWARRAMLMSAFAYYQGNNYNEAISAARRFLSLHPGNESAPYAFYLIALCQFEQIVDVGRDQSTTKQALDSLREVVTRYPNSPYARDARLKIDMTLDQLAGKEMEIGRYYERANEPLAAIGRFQRVIDTYQTTSHAPEALYRLVVAYESLGIHDEAVRYAAVLGHNFRGSDWYADAYALLKGGKDASGTALPTPEEESKREGAKGLRGLLGRTF